MQLQAIKSPYFGLTPEQAQQQISNYRERYQKITDEEVNKLNIIFSKAGLNEIEREIYLAVEMKGKTLEEVGSEMNISAKIAEQIYHRAGMIMVPYLQRVVTYGM